MAHPLDPLSAPEIARATAIIQAHFPWGDDLRVETIDIEEPEKEFVRDHVPGTPFPRIARFNIYRRGVMGVWQGRADLERGDGDLARPSDPMRGPWSRWKRFC